MAIQCSLAGTGLTSCQSFLQAWKGHWKKAADAEIFSHSRSSACSFLKTNQNKVLNDEAKPKPLAQELIGQCGSFESDRDGFSFERHKKLTRSFQTYQQVLQFAT